MERTSNAIRSATFPVESDVEHISQRIDDVASLIERLEERWLQCREAPLRRSARRARATIAGSHAGHEHARRQVAPAGVRGIEVNRCGLDAVVIGGAQKEERAGASG